MKSILTVAVLVGLSSTASAFNFFAPFTSSCESVCHPTPLPGDSEVAAEFAYSIEICKKGAVPTMTITTVEGSKAATTAVTYNGTLTSYWTLDAGVKYSLTYKKPQSAGNVSAKFEIDSLDGSSVESSSYVCVVK